MIEPELDALRLAVAEANAAARAFRAAADQLTAPFFTVQIVEAIRRGVAAEQSPFINIQCAAARWFCSEDAIYRAGRAGILRPARGGVNPMFEKEQGDEAIRSGAWNPAAVAKGYCEWQKARARKSPRSTVQSPPSVAG